MVSQASEVAQSRSRSRSKVSFIPKFESHGSGESITHKRKHKGTGALFYTMTTRVSFNNTIETSQEQDGSMVLGSCGTNFAPRGNSPSWSFAKIIIAHYELKGVWKFVTDDPAVNKIIDQKFKETILKLESGDVACLWDGNSTKIFPTEGHITKVKAAYVKFRYCAGTISPPSKPLARQKSVCVPGFSGVKPVEQRIDDLEERLQRLINLPNEVVYASYVS
jgi:hypothetical protein